MLELLVCVKCNTYMKVRDGVMRCECGAVEQPSLFVPEDERPKPNLRVVREGEK